MQISIIERDAFCICGYAAETCAAQNEQDLNALYKDYFATGKDALLQNLDGSQGGHYGLMWYTQGHERYCYLLGREVGRANTAPEGALLKEIPRLTYAMARFAAGTDAIQAWGDFFFTEIPANGWQVNEEINLYFEYFPKNVEGEFELWTPVIKNHD